MSNPLYKKHLASTEATAVILSQDDASLCTQTKVISRDPYYVYAKIAAFFARETSLPAGVHPTAVIGADCQIDPTAHIGPYCVIGAGARIGAHVVMNAGCIVGENVEIGEGTHFDARVTIYYDVSIGQRVRMASGVVVGSDGFGFAPHRGKWQKVPQLGRVLIGDDVDLGANTTIDRGAIGDTVIGNGVKLDNLVQVGHNVKIDEHTVIAGCVGIAGSTTIGKHCMIGGATGIGGHLTIGDKVMITGMSAITKSIREPGVYSSGVGGVMTNQEWRKNSARLHRLEHLIERVATLEERFKESTER